MSTPFLLMFPTMPFSQRRKLFISLDIAFSKKSFQLAQSREISLIGKEGDRKFGQVVDIFSVFLISEFVFYLAINLAISKPKSERSWIPAISHSI